MMQDRIVEYSIGISGFLAAVAAGYAYAIQFQPGGSHGLFF